MNTTTDNQKCIDACNSLLRGERSAVETYTIAIEKYPATTATAELTRIRSEHEAAVGKLAENVRKMGGEPSADSGAWGAFAKTVQSAADLFGPGSAIESLQTGEKHGLKDYKDALDNPDVMPDCKIMIGNELMPATESHIAVLERLEEVVD